MWQAIPVKASSHALRKGWRFTTHALGVSVPSVGRILVGAAVVGASKLEKGSNLGGENLKAFVLFAIQKVPSRGDLERR